MSSLPPWLFPALIVHAAAALVLLWPVWRAFSHARIGGVWALVLLVPVLGVIAVAVLLGVSVLRRAGWSPAWSVLAIIPLVNVVFLWLFAYGHWTQTRTTLVDEPQTLRRAEPRIAAASAREAASLDEQTLSRPTDDGYEALDPHNRGFAAEIDAPPEVGDVELGEQTMMAGSPNKKNSVDAATLQPPPQEPEQEQEPEAVAEAEPGSPKAESPPSALPPDEMTLAAGVLSDLDAAESEKPQREPPEEPEHLEEPAPPKEPEPPRGRGPDDEARTVPVRHDGPPAGNRVWTLRGVNARSANIEVTIREADLSQSATGILVGRSNRVDFIIGDESVSRNHARFIYQGGSLCVEDLDSMNGTWVDGEALESKKPVAVADKGEVEFGKIKLLVSENGG